jgi:hypothetical protein
MKMKKNELTMLNIRQQFSSSILVVSVVVRLLFAVVLKTILPIRLFQWTAGHRIFLRIAGHRCP